MNDNQPAAFTDGKGDDWTLKITLFSMARVKERIGVDLSGPLRNEWDDVLALQDDQLKLVGAVYAVCQPQAIERGISEDQFYERFSDGDIVDAAAVALLRALFQYFPEKARKPLQKALQDSQRIFTRRQTEAAADLARQMESPEFETTLEKIIDDAIGAKAA